MLTSFVYYVVMRYTWKWPAAISSLVLLLFLSFDMPFFGANTAKLFDGGWVPVLIGVGFIAAMLIWNKGRTQVVEQYSHQPAARRSKTACRGCFLASRCGCRGRPSSCRRTERTSRPSSCTSPSASTRSTSR